MAWCHFLNLRIEYAGWMEISKGDRMWRIGPRRSLKTNEKQRFQKRDISKGHLGEFQGQRHSQSGAVTISLDGWRREPLL